MKNNYLSDLYKIRFSEQSLPRKNEIWKVLCKNFFKKFIKQTDTVIDVACGYGEFTNNVSADVKIAVDLNPDSKSFLDADVEFHQCRATEIGTVLKNKGDVIFTSNFLEHLPNKDVLDLFLDQVMMALKPGGKFLILGPNLKYLAAEYWDFYDHHLGLTHLSLCEALRLNGFSVDQCIDRFLPYTTQGSLPTHPLLVKLYLRFPFVWRILGKQFFIVAQKPV